MYKTSIKIIPGVILFLSILQACNSTPQMHQSDISGNAELSKEERPDTASGRFSDRAHADTKTTQKGLYRISLFCNEYPLPLKKIHTWTLHIETKSGKPVENAKVYIYGGMPAHQHGFPTKPRVTAYLGNGDYKVEGVKFSMPGHWRMRFTILSGEQRDSEGFDVYL